jgi:octaprenyl-diphosphate synthase
MSQAVQPTDDARRRMLSHYAPVQDDLRRVENLLQSELRGDDAGVDELARYSFRLGGKRLRPALLLLAARAVGEVTDEHITLAAVVEMIHTATLIHDDVLDEADLRRHLDTVNVRAGNEASVLLGDFLFTHAFYLASTLSSTFACRTIGRATNITCEGELRQVNSRANYELSEDQYLGIIEAKTAELCACCAQLGAHFAGASPSTEAAMRCYGRNLGIAFQIADDLLDVVGDQQTVGKSLGTDLQKEKLTLPTIHVLSQLDASRRAQLILQLHGPHNRRREALLPYFSRYAAAAYARDKAIEYARAAADELRHVPDSPARDVLMDLTEFVVERRQ